MNISITLGPGETIECPNCGGTGNDPETMFCVMCGGFGTLSYDDVEMAFPEMDGDPLDIETTDYEVHWDSPRLTRPMRGDIE